MKTPRTDLRIAGFIPTPVMRVLRREFGKSLRVHPDSLLLESGLESVFDSAEYKKFKQRATPADYVRVYRENSGLTQAQLGDKLNVSRAYICDIEHNRRAVSKQFAKELAEFFGVSTSCFM